MICLGNLFPYKVDLVDKILSKKENNQDTTAEEREIDMLFYKFLI